MSPLDGMFEKHPRWVALTGAGISAESGIPTYRNEKGEWMRSDPIQHRDFLEKEEARRRYWARSMAGWIFVEESTPNRAHHALSALEDSGHIELLATQNVDGLHQRAGHREVVDLHGRLDKVKCTHCGRVVDRATLQLKLEELNPVWHATVRAIRPDGDADVDDYVVDQMRVPPCEICGGVLMPDVVFFGGTVPRERVNRISAAIARADGLLVAGSSLMVFSGFRFVRQAHALGKPVAILNRGKTRGDELATLKIEEDAGEVLDQLANSVARASSSDG